MVFPHQPHIPSYRLDRRFAFGGPLLKGHARKPRPTSKNFPLFLAFESKSRGGLSSLLVNERWILRLARRLAKRFRVEVVSIRVNSSKDLQMMVRIRKRSDLANFLRSFGGLVPRSLLEKRSFRNRNWQGSFWKQRPFSWILGVGDLYARVLKDLRCRRALVLVAEGSSKQRSQPFRLEIPLLT